MKALISQDDESKQRSNNDNSKATFQQVSMARNELNYRYQIEDKDVLLKIQGGIYYDNQSQFRCNER